MIRVYDLSHHPQLGDVLTCRVYKKGQSLECIRIVANFVDQSDPIGINIFRSPEIGYQTASLEFFEILNSEPRKACEYTATGFLPIP